MNMLDLIYRYDQWGMRQNHAGRRNNNRLDDSNSLPMKKNRALYNLAAATPGSYAPL